MAKRPSQNLTLYPAHPRATMRVYLRDDGQDFLWLDIAATGGGYRRKPGHKIVGAGPFQGWLWSGKKVRGLSLHVGRLVEICCDRKWGTLRYPITRVVQLTPQTKAA